MCEQMCSCRRILCEKETEKTSYQLQATQEDQHASRRAAAHLPLLSGSDDDDEEEDVQQQWRRLWLSLYSRSNTGEEPAELWVHYQTCEETLSALYLMRKTRRLSLRGNYRGGGRGGCMRGDQCRGSHRGGGRKPWRTRSAARGCDGFYSGLWCQRGNSRSYFNISQFPSYISVTPYCGLIVWIRRQWNTWGSN